MRGNVQALDSKQSMPADAENRQVEQFIFSGGLSINSTTVTGGSHIGAISLRC